MTATKNTIVTATPSRRTSAAGWWWCEPTGWTPADPRLTPPGGDADLDAGVIWGGNDCGLAGLAVYTPWYDGHPTIATTRPQIETPLSSLAWLGGASLQELSTVTIGGSR